MAFQPMAPADPARVRQHVIQQLLAQQQQQRAPSGWGDVIANLGGQALGLAQGMQMENDAATRQQAMMDALGGTSNLPPGAPMAAQGVPIVDTPGGQSLGPASTPGLAGQAGISEQELRLLMLADPTGEMATKFALEKMNRPPVISKPGDIARDAQGNIVFQNDPLPPDPSTHEQKLAAAGLTPGTPEAREFLAGKGSTTTVNVPAGEKQIDINYADRVSKENPEETRALNQIQRGVGQLKGMLDEGTQTGFVPRLTALANNLTGYDFGPNAQGIQVFQAVARDLVLKAQQAQKGPQTDSDRAVIESTLPSAGTSTGANKAIVNVIEGLNKRALDELNFERKYYAEHGTLNGFEEARAAKFDNVPIFAAGVASTGAAAAGASGAPVDTTAYDHMTLDQMIGVARGQ